MTTTSPTYALNGYANLLATLFAPTPRDRSWFRARAYSSLKWAGTQEASDPMDDVNYVGHPTHY